AGGDPPVALPVDAEEHVALVEIGAVQIARRMSARPQLEQDGREPHVLDCVPGGGALVGQLLQRGADEDAHSLIGRTDGWNESPPAARPRGPAPPPSPAPPGPRRGHRDTVWSSGPPRRAAPAAPGRRRPARRTTVRRIARSLRDPPRSRSHRR